jgi:TatD DNase family protein
VNALVDIGANLADKAFRADLPAVLARAAEAGVLAILVTGTSAAGSRRAREIAVERRAGPAPRLFATAGVHPHQASSASREVYRELRELLARPEVVAVGECGLDYDRDFSPRPVQRACFEAQLEIASEVQKPVFLHERAAHDDFASALERWRPRLAGGVVHCFTGERRALERYLDLDLYAGITGWICDERRGAHLRELVRIVPEGRLLVETDAPYLLPRDLDRPGGGAGSRGRNEPALVAHVARTVAACRGEPFEALAAHTTAAARRLFGIGPAPG